MTRRAARLYGSGEQNQTRESFPCLFACFCMQRFVFRDGFMLACLPDILRIVCSPLVVCDVIPYQEDVEWCQSNTTARWAEDVLGVLSTVSRKSLSAGFEVSLVCRCCSFVGVVRPGSIAKRSNCQSRRPTCVHCTYQFHPIPPLCVRDVM